MDDLLDTLSGINVAGQQNSIHAEHPRFSQFKSKKSKSSQEERRKAVLAARKCARYDVFNHMRHVELGADEDKDVAADQEEDMQGVDECYKKPKFYKDFLMFSEWLVEVPEDFASTFIAVPCPVGKRCLVVAGNGYTTMYARNGSYVERFNSVLPGGSPISAKRGYAMFDCVANYQENVFYVLDMIAWCNQSMMQCETSFRFEWTRSRLSENDYDVNVISENNDYKFVGIEHFSCDQQSLQRMLCEPLSFSSELDGILFYHRETHYTHGATPLVGWLKAYMMKEILGLHVPDKYASERPEKYENLTQHIEYGKQAREARLANNAEIKRETKEKKAAKHKAVIDEKRKKGKVKSMDCDTEGAVADGAEADGAVADGAEALEQLDEDVGGEQMDNVDNPTN